MTEPEIINEGSDIKPPVSEKQLTHLKKAREIKAQYRQDENERNKLVNQNLKTVFTQLEVLTAGLNNINTTIANALQNANNLPKKRKKEADEEDEQDEASNKKTKTESSTPGKETSVEEVGTKIALQENYKDFVMTIGKVLGFTSIAAAVFIYKRHRIQTHPRDYLYKNIDG